MCTKFVHTAWRCLYMYVLLTLKALELKCFLRFFNFSSSNLFLSFSLIARSFSCCILSFSASFSLFFCSLSSDLDTLQVIHNVQQCITHMAATMNWSFKQDHEVALSYICGLVYIMMQYCAKWCFTNSEKFFAKKTHFLLMMGEGLGSVELPDGTCLVSVGTVS